VRRHLVLLGELLLCVGDAQQAVMYAVGRHAIDAGHGRMPALTAAKAEQVARDETAKCIAAYGPAQGVQLVVDE